MKTTFNKQYIIDNKGCYDEGQVNQLSFIDKSIIIIEDIINSEISLKDKFWFLIRNCDLTNEQKQQISLEVAEIVLPIYEDKYPNNTAPREAIQSAKDYIQGNITLDMLLKKKRAAAYAAYAADAAYAAYAAAATDAYAAATYAAAAADAADAYAAAAYAAANNKYTKQLEDYLISFVKENTIVD